MKNEIIGYHNNTIYALDIPKNLFNNHINYMYIGFLEVCNEDVYVHGIPKNELTEFENLYRLNLIIL